MKFLICSALLLFSLSTFAETNYGKGEYSTEPVKLSTLMKDYSQYQGKKVVTTGTVYEVCTMEGCWLKLQDGDARVRVVMKEHGFTVPKEIKGKTIKLEGVMEQKEMPAKVIQHYMKDEGKPQKEIDKVTSPQKMFQFIADGVRA